MIFSMIKSKYYFIIDNNYKIIDREKNTYLF